MKKVLVALVVVFALLMGSMAIAPHTTGMVYAAEGGE